jgi:Xaa-Pro aminopeptidase
VIIKDIFPEINAYLKPLKIKNLGVEADYLTYNFIELMKKELAVEKIVPTSVRKLRMVKSPEEIQNLQRAAQIGDESLIEVCKKFKIGKNENEIENELFQCFIQKGADKVFPRVVLTSGIRGALPHGKPTNKKIQQGELVTVDFGCLYQGYCSDMTRTIAVGEVDPELRKIYQIVQKAQQAGIEAVKPGMKCSEIHQIV